MTPVTETETNEEERRGKGHMKMKADIGVVLPQAKQCPEPLEARSSERILS